MSEPTPINGEELRRHPLPVAKPDDKYAHGTLLLAAGSRQTSGSAAIGATAALRSGCGKVTVATSADVAPHVAMQVPEARVLWLEEGGHGGFATAALSELPQHLELADAVVAGPGIANGTGCRELAEVLLTEPPERLVLDAAILFELSTLAELCRRAAPILLPHDREMAALICCDEQEVERAALRCGHRCSERYGALVLMKGPVSHVVAPDGRTWRYKGCEPGLGIAGSGDVLAGILGGLLARGAEPLTALLWAVWLHGEAGAALARKVGPIGYLSREISGEVPALLQWA